MHKPTLKSYRREKISILRDFGIHLTETQQERFTSLENEIRIDNFCKKLITDKLDASTTTLKGKYN